MTKFYIHSQIDPWAVYRTSGKYYGGDVAKINSVQMKNGSWLGVCYIDDAVVLEKARKEEGVTFLPSLPSNEPLSAAEIALLAHVDPPAGSTMRQAAKLLHAFHGPLGFLYFHPDC